VDISAVLQLHKQQMPPDLRDAHKHSSIHRSELEAGSSCGCFYCCSIFHPSEVIEWCDANELNIGQTAICPKCGVDSVLGSSSNYPINTEFLQLMKSYWFKY
jgi:hypothetical protein